MASRLALVSAAGASSSDIVTPSLHVSQCYGAPQLHDWSTTAQVLRQLCVQQVHVDLL